MSTKDSPLPACRLASADKLLPGLWMDSGYGRS